MSFPRYPSYKDSTAEWIACLPSHWDVTRLKRRVASTNAGEVIDKSYWGGEDELLYTCAIEPMWSDFHDFPDWKRTTTHDLLLTRNGTPYIHKPVEKSIYTNVVQRITLANPLERDFLALAAQSAANNLQGYGVSIESLNYGMWSELLVPEPPLEEALLIASFIDRETAKIDALIAEQQRLIELLQEKRQAVISHAATKGLNPNAPMKDSGVEWLGEVPEHWEDTKLKRLFRLRKAQGYPHLEVLSVYRDYGVIAKNSRSDNFNKTPEDLSKYQLVEPGDLVINKMKCWQGSLGISPKQGITSPDYLVFSPVHQENGEFLHSLVRSSAYSSIYLAISNGIRPNQWRVESDRFLALSVFLPRSEEQIRIAEHIKSQVKEFNSLTEMADLQVSLLQERRSALISAAVTGQIDVRELATDEAIAQ